MARGDRILDLLMEMARDGFPQVFSWDRGGARGAPAHPRTQMAPLADDRQLRSFAKEPAPFITSTSGHGSQIQTGSLPGLLIASASAAHVAKGRLTGDLDAFLEEVSKRA